MRGVAEWMYDHAELVLGCGSELLRSCDDGFRRQMYMIGYLHDVGKAFFSISEHAVLGGVLLSGMMKDRVECGSHCSPYSPAKVILQHGNPDPAERSGVLDLLNAADLSVDSSGKDIGWKARLEDIRSRYGAGSVEAAHAEALVRQLVEIGYLNKSGEPTPASDKQETTK